MAERNHDDIAAALHGLSAGDSSAESAAGEVVDAGSAADAAPTPAPPPPAGARAPAARPVAPGGSPRERPVAAPGRPSAPARPPGPAAGPARPSVPQLQRQAAPPAARPSGPVRPSAPGAQQTPDAPHEDVAASETPAPIEYRSAPRRPAPGPPFFKTLGFRRTTIPILVCTGLMMLVMALLPFFVDEASPMAMLPTWTPVLLFVMGPILVLLGIANMLQVKRELAPKR